MTKVGRIFLEEKLDALREQEAELTRKFARKLILGNIDVVDIMNYTGLSRKEIEEMQGEVLADLTDTPSGIYTRHL